jgi:hypothetical protein
MIVLSLPSGALVKPLALLALLHAAHPPRRADSGPGAPHLSVGRGSSSTHRRLRSRPFMSPAEPPLALMFAAAATQSTGALCRAAPPVFLF